MSPGMKATIVVVLDGAPEQALRCLAALAELPEHPAHEVVVVDDASVGLGPLLARLEGDVEIVRLPHRSGFAAAVQAGLRHATAPVAVLLRGAPELQPGALAPLLIALDDPAVAAATSVADSSAPEPSVAAHVLAARRADLADLGGALAVPPGLEVAALVAALARTGRVEPVPSSVARPPGARTGGVRRPPGEQVELSIVIPTLDATSERVRRCVAAVQNTTDAAHEIIIVDNGAPPQGFTAPVNSGLRAARGAFCVVMNDDVETLDGWWPPLRGALTRPNLPAAVAFPRTIDGPVRHDFAAWCFALSRATLDEFSVAPGEFLDPDLVVWYQDTDLLERLRAAGRPPEHVVESRIRHGLSETVLSDDGTLRAWIARQVMQDKAAFEARHGVGVAGAAR
jgi:glycosyltransferase involved in cell wall biosynthesis